ncbi:MAG: hypothetical protein NTV34_09300, partial [Proteobacteria bacterium]|nr:hypothetical protein [Pseudomonadota bacterium]
MPSTADKNLFTGSIETANESENIDLIDIIGVFWKAKIFLGVGVLIGVLAALVVVNFKEESIHVTKIQLNTAPFPASAIEAAVTRINTLIVQSDTANAVYSRLESDPDKSVLTSLVGQGLSREKFIRLQSDLKGAGNFPLKFYFAKDENTIVAETRLPSSEEKPILSAALTRATLDEIFQDRLLEYRKLVKKRELESAKIQQEMLTLENQLRVKLGASALPPTIPDQDYIPRLVSLLRQSRKITETEAETILLQRADFAARMKMNSDGSLNTATAASTEALKTFSDQWDHSPSFFDMKPSLKIDKSQLEYFSKNRSIEKPHTKRTLFILIGIVFGLV